MDTQERIRVLVVDDDPSFVEAVHMMLSSDQRLEVVGGAANGREAIEQVEALRPEVVAMDIAMPVMDGIQATKMIRSSRPDCQVVLVSGSIFQAAEEGSEAAREAGASAYVVKSRAMLDLVDTVVSVAQASTVPSA